MPGGPERPWEAAALGKPLVPACAYEIRLDLLVLLLCCVFSTNPSFELLQGGGVLQTNINIDIHVYAYIVYIDTYIDICQYCAYIYR